MKIWYWGTAAAEGIPGIFCRCDVCKEAREKGDRYVRTRSQLLVDDTLMMDFNADTYMHSLKYGFDLSTLKNVIITHSHGDHYYSWDFLMRGKGFSHGIDDYALTVHGSEDIKERFDYETKNNHGVIDSGRIAFKTLEPYKTYDIGEHQVTPLPAVHGTPHPYVYIIKSGEKHALILNDTGYPKAEVLDYLKNSGIKFDLISYDCTYCAGDTLKDWGPNASHMGLVNILDLRNELIKNGNCKDTAVHVLTHFSHNGPDASYMDMRKHATKHGFALAYDGYCIEI